MLQSLASDEKFFRFKRHIRTIGALNPTTEANLAVEIVWTLHVFKANLHPRYGRTHAVIRHRRRLHALSQG